MNLTREKSEQIVNKIIYGVTELSHFRPKEIKVVTKNEEAVFYDLECN